MTYSTLFDAQTVPFNYLVPALFAGVAVLSAGWMALSLQRQGFGIVRTTRQFLVFGFAMLLLLTSGEGWAEHLRFQHAATGAGSTVIEGIVRDYRLDERVKETSSAIKVISVESFRISGVVFDYVRTQSLKPYFTNALDHAVALHDGMRLRIAYVDAESGPRIVRLEAAR